MKFYEKESESMEELVESLIFPEGKSEMKYNTLEGEDARSQILITPFEHVTSLNLDKYRSFIKQRKEALQSKEQEVKEKAELKRLKEKYE